MTNERKRAGSNVDAARSRQMALIRGRDTKPEMTVRRLVHSLGYRYRIHYARLPGKPDMVFPARRKVIFVNGCFWHRHNAANCWRARLPKSRLDFWAAKLNANVARDIANMTAIKREGWDVMVIWECQTTPRGLESLKKRVIEFLR